MPWKPSPTPWAARCSFPMLRRNSTRSSTASIASCVRSTAWATIPIRAAPRTLTAASKSKFQGNTRSATASRISPARSSTKSLQILFSEEFFKRVREGFRFFREWKMAAFLENHKARSRNIFVYAVGDQRRHIHVIATGNNQGEKAKLPDFRIQIEPRQIGCDLLIDFFVVCPRPNLRQKRFALLRRIKNHRQILADERVIGGLVPKLSRERARGLPFRRFWKYLIEEKDRVAPLGSRGVH